MVYCVNCGEKISLDYAFCPKCGTKLVSNISNNFSSSDEVKESINKMSQEMERIFNIAITEMQNVIQKAKSNLPKTNRYQPVKCHSCFENNPSESIYCYNCGKKLVK